MAAKRSAAPAGEFSFIEKLIGLTRAGAPRLPLGAVGPGQDCAVVPRSLRRSLLTVDSLVDGVHFRSAWMSPRQIGRKAFLVNASDIAAMGGRPRWFLVNLGAPRDCAEATLCSLQRGLVEAGREHGARLIGGNLTRSRQLTATVFLLGEAPRHLVQRSGARPGDRIVVTGTLGDAALGRAQLQRDRSRRGHAVHRFREPQPRLRAGRLLAQNRVASAMIDVSDGLGQDLAHLCRQSGVGALVHAVDLPLSPAFRRARAALALALGGGEDYELICTVPATKMAALERLTPRLDCTWTVVGKVTRGRRLCLLGEDGSRAPLGAGHDHFA